MESCHSSGYPPEGTVHLCPVGCPKLGLTQGAHGRQGGRSSTLGFEHTEPPRREPEWHRTLREGISRASTSEREASRSIRRARERNRDQRGQSLDQNRQSVLQRRAFRSDQNRVGHPATSQEEEEKNWQEEAPEGEESRQRKQQRPHQREHRNRGQFKQHLHRFTGFGASLSRRPQSQAVGTEIPWVIERSRRDGENFSPARWGGSTCASMS